MMSRILSAALLGLLVVSSALAAPPKDAKDFMKHLKKEGYECEKGDNFITANHDVQLNIVVKGYNGGVLVQTYAGSNVKDRDDIIDTVNALNANATVTRFYIDGDGVCLHSILLVLTRPSAWIRSSDSVGILLVHIQKR